MEKQQILKTNLSSNAGFGNSALKSRVDSRRAFKPLTFTALALKPSTSIKCIKGGKTVDGRETGRKNERVSGWMGGSVCL